MLGRCISSTATRERFADIQLTFSPQSRTHLCFYSFRAQNAGRNSRTRQAFRLTSRSTRASSPMSAPKYEKIIDLKIQTHEFFTPVREELFDPSPIACPPAHPQRRPPLRMYPVRPQVHHQRPAQVPRPPPSRRCQVGEETPLQRLRDLLRQILRPKSPHAQAHWRASLQMHGLFERIPIAETSPGSFQDPLGRKTLQVKLMLTCTPSTCTFPPPYYSCGTCHRSFRAPGGLRQHFKNSDNCRMNATEGAYSVRKDKSR